MKSLQEFKVNPGLSEEAFLEELEEGIVTTSDYKIGPSGRKVRAHRIVFNRNADSLTDVEDEDQYVTYEPEDKEDDKEDKKKDKKIKEEVEILEEMKGEPPFVLVLKRKAIRLYPNKTKVALYYSDKLKKYFTVPYSNTKNVQSIIQAEETELTESVLDNLYKIVEEKQARSVQFTNGQTKKIDYFTASVVTKVHAALNEDNRKKFEEMMCESSDDFMKAANFAYKNVK